MNRREFLQNAGAMSAPLFAGGKMLGDTTDHSSFPSLEIIKVGGVDIRPSAPPHGLYNRPDLGILINRGMTAQRIYAHVPPENWCGESRGIKTPGGDFLVMFTAGTHHYGGQMKKTNDMVAFRSSDRGKTWTGPQVAWNIPYNQHGFSPLIPHGTKRIYAFGTEPLFNELELPEDAPIGFRFSDDDGHSWSGATIIHPTNDPNFRGFFVMRMCETGEGTWLLAPSASAFNHNCPDGKTWCPPVTSRSYIMRTTDRGQTWTLLPHPQPDGFTVPKFNRMDEARPISLGGAKVLLLVRTNEGHLWQLRSEDDGKSWTEPQPTTLVHPAAPPMIFHLSDGKTLVVFIHNRFAGVFNDVPGNGQDRSELWSCISTDDGQTWSEPRFVIANSAGGGHMGQFADWSVSYVDLLVDHGLLHLIISHQFRQVLAIRFDEKLLHRFPTKAELARAVDH